MDAAAITAIIGIVGILLGTLIAPRVNHNLGARYNRKDLLFKRKLEYFEKIVDTIEKNKRMYNQTIGKIEFSKDKKEIKKVVEELKQSRKNFLIMASPLYFDVRALSERIVRFVRVEKEIFNRISVLIDKEKKRCLY
ncbi:hypothetical protein M0R19_00335 [Candidatus Pacearchaeota archaeon]|jgi:DNA-binding LacI/PurR family transcriptional regulator|nr:hypothetical protein [Candidatus Pacearchaeota archaeon]